MPVHFNRGPGHIRSNRLLKQPPRTFASFGFKEPQVRTALADVYGKLEEHEKAIGHLRKVLDDTNAEADTRRTARTALVASFKKVGRLDALIEKYATEVSAVDEHLGRD